MEPLDKDLLSKEILLPERIISYNILNQNNGYIIPIINDIIILLLFNIIVNIDALVIAYIAINKPLDKNILNINIILYGW